MKSLKAGTLTQAELAELGSKIKTPHLQDLFNHVIYNIVDGEFPDCDALVSSGHASFGVAGKTTLSNDDDTGFVLLFVDGDLAVRGSLTIEDDPPALLVVTGNLVVEDSLVCAGWIEVQGMTKIGKALAGDYNHGEAHFYGDVSAAVLIDCGDYPLSFANKETFETEVVDGAIAGPIVKKIREGKEWSLPKK